ncbi:phosphopantetheine-binding protein, partial [Eubacterium ruminantium]|uniref:phosphopantetheine-binding protein n=1 Tax=Eubacterium ruminantium TaxID=42322 RepID=UPI002478A61C
MESLPLSANGKVDRKKLPKVDISEINIYVAPENETEEELCHLFEEILKLPKIGTEDDFFMNGGHSLRATNLINKIEYKFGVRLMLKDVFENPTVKKIAGILNDNVEKLKPIEKAEVRPSYPMSDHEKRMFIAHEMDDTKIAYNVT